MLLFCFFLIHFWQLLKTQRFLLLLFFWIYCLCFLVTQQTGVRDRSFITSQGEGYNFWKGLILGGQFSEMYKVWGGSKFWDTGLTLYVVVVKTYHNWNKKNTFPSLLNQKVALTTLCRQTNRDEDQAIYLWVLAYLDRKIHWVKNIDCRLLPNVSISMHQMFLPCSQRSNCTIHLRPLLWPRQNTENRLQQ